MRRLFLLVAAVVLVDTMFYAAITPLLPHYQNELGLSKSDAGVLAASYAAGTLLGSIPAGWLAARAGCKNTLLLGLAALGATSIVFGLAQNVLLLESARFIQGVGGACSWAAGMAWLVGASPPERRGELIGSALGAAIVGVMLGPVLGGAATLAGPAPVFGAVSLVAAVLAAWAWTMPGVGPGLSPSLASLGRALRRRRMLTGFWLFTLPAVFAGVLEVLVPLRMDALGATGVAVGAAFLVASAAEAVVSPWTGRISDRRGRLFPIRAGLAGATVTAIVLPWPETAVVLAAMLVLAIASLGTFWAPGMALLSDASEEAGLDQGLAFALANLAWAGGHVLGGGAGASLADATADAVPYALLGVACAVTLARLLAPVREQFPHGAVPRNR
ncbi:MAG TPA: MFS transporter [Thermoleophilaceae bacterium]